MAWYLVHAQKLEYWPILYAYANDSYQVIFIAFLLTLTLVNGFMVKWGSSQCHPSHPPHFRHCTMSNGWQRLFHQRRLQARTLLQQYYAALSPGSTGWESKPVQHFSICQQLQVEAMLLGHAFDCLALHFLPWDYCHQPPDFSFTRSSFADPTMQPLLSPGFPNLQDIFGDQAPLEPKTYSTTCHLQCCAANNFSICFDTGCTMFSTFSLDNFKELPVKGHFGQLWMINHVIPIKAAGIICWHVLNSKGQPTIIHNNNNSEIL